jgi:hypothetical protein
MNKLYLGLAIAGAVLPFYFFLQPVEIDTLGLMGVVGLGFANPIAAGLTTDLLISSIVFWVYMFSAGDNAPKPWAFIAINFFIGLSCALPAYLYWRTRQG